MEIKEILRSLVKGNNLPIMLLVIFIGSLFSAMIPPFQSPDEFDHIKRAYLLSKCQVFLDTPPRLSSGGNVDSGLLQYMGLYGSLPHHPEERVSQETSISAQNINWSKTREFSAAPGTGYYFPLAYIPQASGLMIGELLDLSVETSYRLARLMVLVSSVFLISIAFSIYPTNPLAIALLTLPMSIFQFASASLDALITALSIFAISVFLRISDRGPGSSAWLAYALGASVFILVSCKVNLIPLLALPYLVYYLTRNKKHLYLAVIVSIAAFAWVLVAMKTTHYYRYSENESASNATMYYLTNPALFIKVLANTIGSSVSLTYYMQSFIGILGWLDTRFSEIYYYAMSGILVLLAICSASPRRIGWPRKVLLGSACISVVLIFFALLVAWNPVPAEFIRGVQGRYFLVPALLISYSLTATIESFRGVMRKILIALLVVLAVATLRYMPDLLIYRYYI